jgi:hypothetical protein
MIPFGKAGHQINVTRNENGIFNTPTEVTMDDDNYYVADIKGAKILIISRDKGEVKEIIGDKKKLTEKSKESDSLNDQNHKNKMYSPLPIDNILKDKTSGDKETIIPNRNLSKKAEKMLIHDAAIVYPGKIHVTRDGMLFIQNRIPIKATPFITENANHNNEAEYVPETAPSHVLVLNQKRKIVKELYSDNVKKTPFKQIMGIYDRDKQEAIIVHRENPREWFIQSFQMNTFKNIYTFQINADFIKEKDKISKSDDYYIFIENIIPKFNKMEFFISVAYYKNTRFKFRRIFILNIKNQNKLTLYTELQEPQNELYASIDNNSVYLWNSEAYNEIKLKIFDSSGDLINNKKIKLFGKDEAWRNFIPMSNGSIIALYISRIGMEIILWS